jgi:hypothetical protein
VQKTFVAGLAVSALVCASFTPAMASTEVTKAAGGTLRSTTHDGRPLDATLQASPAVRGASRAAASSTGQLTMTIGSGWSDSERSVLEVWTAGGSAELTTLAQTVGPPGHDETVTVTKDPTSPFAGEYQPSGHLMVMASLDLAVFMHELNHAVRDTWILSDAVWEEGLARAAEVVEMDRLAAQGIPKAQHYWDLHHSAGYDEYYENTNVPDVGVAGGSIWGNGDAALALLRYQQAGYAFGKILLRNPNFIARFDALLFQRPNGDLDSATLAAMAGSIVPWVEARRFPVWVSRQHIFDTTPPVGCRLLQRVSQYTVDFFCRSSTGLETPQAGATVTYRAYGARGALLYDAQATTTRLGWVQFDPSFGSYHGRVQLVASATAADGSVRSTAYRRAVPEGGVFGVIRNALSGSVVFSSPNRRFTKFTVPVSAGAFATTRLAGFAGRVIASFAGGGKTAKRLFVKDASPYSLVLSASA